MRWTVLLLAAACSVVQSKPIPPPPPLAVPAENAEGPAGLPDAGQPDGGGADAGAGSPDAGTRADLVSPITAAGTEVALGLEWGEKGELPASILFQNARLLGSLSGDRFMAAMQSMRANLGQTCAQCHSMERKDYASDDKAEKRRSRDMIRMNDGINRRIFGGKVRVTCWTCHRGEEKPPLTAFSKELPEPFAKMPPEQLAKKAGAVFKDLRSLQDMDVRNFGLIMAWFGRSLGGQCTHCHLEGDFPADTPKKTRARQMLEMTSWIAKEYYGNDSPIGCDTCHRGSPAPPRTPADKS